MAWISDTLTTVSVAKSIISALVDKLITEFHFFICCCQPQSQEWKYQSIGGRKLSLDTESLYNWKNIYNTLLQMASQKGYRILFFTTAHKLCSLFQNDGVVIFYFYHQPKHIQTFPNSNVQGLLQIWFLVPGKKQSKRFGGRSLIIAFMVLEKVYAQDSTSSWTNLWRLVWTLIVLSLCLNSQTCMQPLHLCGWSSQITLSQILSINDEMAVKSVSFYYFLENPKAWEIDQLVLS